LDELKEKSESEDFEEEKKKLLNVEVGVDVESLKSKIKQLNVEMKIKQQEFQTNIARLENNIKFSREANSKLRQDYDL
jgi:hypothetical protein